MDRFSYQQTTHWELHHESTDFETHGTNTFFKAIKVIIKQILNLTWVSIRIGELKGKKLVAKDVKKEKLEKMLKSPIAYHSLKSLRTSLDYIETMKITLLQ